MSTTASDLLVQLLMQDVSVLAEGDTLRCNAPQGVLTGTLQREIAANKAELLKLLAGDTATTVDDEDTAPLSFAQQRMWILDSVLGGVQAYNINGSIRLQGLLDIEVLERSVSEIVRRHAVLRTTFEFREPGPVQVRHAPSRQRVEIIDVSMFPEGEREGRLQELVRGNSSHRFDLRQGPLFRLMLLRSAIDDHLLVATTHHIISDGWSMRVFIGELGTLYTAYLDGRGSPMPELPIQYADFAWWERQQLRDAQLEKLLGFWGGKLAGRLPSLELPSDRPRPPVQSFAGAIVRTPLPKQLGGALRALAEAEHTTLFSALLAAFAAFLHRHNGQTDILIGMPVANRDRLVVEGLIGLFANTVVVRANLTGCPTFRETLRRVGGDVLDALAHQQIPFEKLVEHLKPARDASRNPIFQAMLVLQHPEDVRLELPGLTISVPQASDGGTSKFDLTATFIDNPGQMDLVLEYSTALFDKSTMQAMLARFVVLLESITVQPDLPVSALPLLPVDERRQIEVWNATSSPHLPDAVFSRQFEAGVARHPDLPAVSFKGLTLSYGELNARANQLARLLRDFGVGPGVSVGVCLERGLDLLVALLGVQKSGGAYVPLDPGFPADRVSYMLADSGAPLLVTTAGALQGVMLPTGLRQIDLGAEAAMLAEQSAANLPVAAGPQDPVYVIYTSGSTGRPKGVVVSNGALLNFLGSMRIEPGLSAQDVLAAVTTISFDIAGLELYLPLLVGARVELIAREAASDGRVLAGLLADTGATVLQATPATWRMLVEADFHGGPGFKALCGGEALSRELADALLGRVGELWNLYGPTETTIWSTAERIEEGAGPITIGRPIANTCVHVLDAAGEPTPIGVPGELWISGSGVAIGYHARPDLTSQRFSPERFGLCPSGRMYRTGDLGRWRTDGRLEHLGRVDQQVKIRGFRIELGEIEAVLEAHPAVRRCLFEARRAGPDDTRLVGYVMFRQEASLTSSEVRRYLRLKLPEYMIPSIIIALDAIPLTPNGKVDRAALPDPFKSASELSAGAEVTLPGLETRLADIWRELLQIDRVGPQDNFFDLGGHSLLAMRATNAFEKATGARLDPRSMFFQDLRRVVMAAERSEVAMSGGRAK